MAFLPVVRIEFPPIGHESGLAVVEEGAQVDTVVPIRGEVLDLAVWEDGLEGRLSRKSINAWLLKRKSVPFKCININGHASIS